MFLFCSKRHTQREAAVLQDDWSTGQTSVWQLWHMIRRWTWLAEKYVTRKRRQGLLWKTTRALLLHSNVFTVHCNFGRIIGIHKVTQIHLLAHTYNTLYPVLHYVQHCIYSCQWVTYLSIVYRVVVVIEFQLSSSEHDLLPRLLTGAASWKWLGLFPNVLYLSGVCWINSQWRVQQLLQGPWPSVYLTGLIK